MKYTSFVLGCLLAVGVLTMTACGAAENVPKTTTAAAPVTALQTEKENEATMAGGTVAAPESFTFERVSFEGEGFTVDELEAYLAEHRESLLDAMRNHGVSESESLEILAIPLHSVDLRTGVVDLNSHYLPMIEDGTMIGAARVSAREGLSVSARTAELSWMSVVDRCLKADPKESYLLADCYTSEGAYFCLISSQNEITYLVRPEGGEDLPFESGKDYYGKLYDERLAISYDKIYAEKKPIREILLRCPSGNLYYYSQSQLLSADFSGEQLDLEEPLATEGIIVTETRPMPAGKYEELCDTLYRVHFELFPETKVEEGAERLTVNNGKNTVIVYYEDGTSFIVQIVPQTIEENALFAYLMSAFARKM